MTINLSLSAHLNYSQCITSIDRSNTLIQSHLILGKNKKKIVKLG